MNPHYIVSFLAASIDADDPVDDEVRERERERGGGGGGEGRTQRERDLVYAFPEHTQA